ncbi:MAG: class I SAM-dependent methyltransferase [Nitrospiraceae bacterium]|nr:class I SAM-dependent methyltransferase [Nitrospiraceae bacterium]
MNPSSRPCPVCRSQDLTEYREIDGALRLLKCTDCGLVFLDPVPGDLSVFYEGYRREGGKRFLYGAETLVKYFRVRRARMIDRLFGPRRKTDGAVKKNDGNPRVLDIGCGRGLMLAELKSRGFECYGTELPGQAPFRQKTGDAPFTVYEGDLTELDLPGGFFDVVTVWHVLEHVRDPVQTLKEVRRILKPGGLLVISVPNIGSLQAKLFGRRWIHLDLPRHLYHFSPGPLAHALKQSGFAVEGFRHFSAEHGVSGMILSFGALMSGSGPDLFSTLRGEGKRYGAIVSAMAFAPAAFFLSVIEAVLRMGGVITVVAEKPLESGPGPEKK